MSETLKIKSVSELLNLLPRHKPDLFQSIYFRGEAKDFGDTAFKPSIFRNKKWEFNETAMFNDVLLESPQSFEKDKSTFEKLVRMQHYGLPTRLLDITSNPLVALYFACKDEPKKDGIFYTITAEKINIKSPTDEDVSFLSNVVLLGNFDDEITSRSAIKDFLEKREKYTKEYIEIMDVEDEETKNNTFSKLWNLTETGVFKFLNEGLSNKFPLERLGLFEEMLLVKPPRNNLRQSSQAGDFLIFGNNARFNKDGKFNSHSINRLLVQASKKEDILEELDLININQYSLFPELSTLCNLVKTRYNNSKIDYSKL